MGKIRSRSDNQKLFFDFTFLDKRCREQTTLPDTVIPPFLALARNRGQAARANFCLGVMPPRAIFGLS